MCYFVRLLSFLTTYFNRLYESSQRYCFPSILFHPCFKVLNYVLDFVNSSDTKIWISELDFYGGPPSLSAISSDGFLCFPKKGFKSFLIHGASFGGNSSRAKWVLFAGLDKDLFVYQSYSRQKLPRKWLR